MDPRGSEAPEAYCGPTGPLPPLYTPSSGTVLWWCKVKGSASPLVIKTPINHTKWGVNVLLTAWKN